MSYPNRPFVALEGVRIVSAVLSYEETCPGHPNSHLGDKLTLTTDEGKTVELWTCECCGLNLFVDGEPGSDVA